MSTSKDEELKDSSIPVLDLQGYLQEQVALNQKICNAFVKLQKKGWNKVSLAVLRESIESLKAQWSRFRVIYARYLVPKAERITKDYFKNQLFDKTETTYNGPIRATWLGGTAARPYIRTKVKRRPFREMPTQL